MNKIEVKFSWNIHGSCNFRCPYCWHANKWEEFRKKNVYPGLEKLIQVWKRIYDLYGKCHIDILGGEPSIYPDINELLLELIKCHEVWLTTNLSGDFDKLIDSVSPDLVNNIRMATTFHPMFANLDTFLSKAIKIKNKIKHDVVYLAYPPQIKDLEKYKKIFEQNGLTFSVLTFWGTYNGKKYPDSYTDEEKKIIGLSLASRSGEKFQTEQFVPKEKLCNAGHKYALIDPDGRCLSCGGIALDIKKNIFDSDFKLLDKPMKCPSQKCPCNEWAELLV